VELSEARDAVALFDGPTLHGFQVLSPEQRLVPTSYYSVDSAVGIADTFIRRRHSGQPLKYGVIGLGTGTIAAYGQEGDSIVFYELDSKIKQIAEQYFTFLRESKADVDIALGDARQTLEKRPSEHFDMLVVDAFSGDSVPYHLLTREAVELFLKHVKPDGIILFHVSSKYLNLTPVISNVAISIGLSSVWLDTAPTDSDLALHSNYVVISREQAFSKALGVSQFRDAYPNVRWLQLASDLHRGVWTDDHVNLLSVLNISVPPHGID
jgi:spermidine synthase